MFGPQLRIFNWPGVTQMAKHKKHLKVTSNRCLILCRSDQKAWPQLRSFTRTLTHVLSKWLRLHETSREETFQETQMEALRLFWPSFKRHESYFHHVLLSIVIFSSVQFSSVTQSCPTLCDPMDCSTPGLPVYHQLPEFTQTHVRWVSDAIQPSHSLLSPSPPAFNPSQHHSLFKWVSSLH